MPGGRRPWRVMEANAATGLGLTDVITWLFDNAIRRLDGTEEEVLAVEAVTH